MNAEQLIFEERIRQKSVEGWSDAHDDTHQDGQMLKAAVIYFLHGTNKAAPIPPKHRKPIGWPWAPEWWKPKDRTSNLVRAGALAMAEIERLKRAGQPYGHAEQKYEMIKSTLDARVKNPNFAACCNSTDISVCDCARPNHISVRYS